MMSYIRNEQPTPSSYLERGIYTKALSHGLCVSGVGSEVATMQVNLQFLQQLPPEWSRFVTNEVNEICAEKIARNANPLALVAAVQYSHAPTGTKGKEVAKPRTPLSLSASEEDSDPEQAHRDKDMQKSIALIAKYFTKIYKPTNNNLRTSSNSKNKNVDSTPRTENDRQTRQFSFNCKEYGHFAKECRKPKRVKDYSYHKEKMMLCKHEEKCVPLSAEQSDWLQTTDEESDEKELEAHYLYMAKIQEVLQVTDDNSGPTYDTEPMERVSTNNEYNVFAKDNQHSEQHESINNTYIMEKFDSNIILDHSDNCNNEFEDDQNVDPNDEDERVQLANLIANLKLDIDENKKIQNQLRKENATLTHELNESKYALTESNNTRDRCRNALHQKEVKLEKYITYKNCQLEKEEIEHLLMHLAEKTRVNASKFERMLKEEMFDDLQYVQSLEKELDELQYDENEFSNEYDLLLQECLINNIMCAALSFVADIDEYSEMACKYLEKVKECECLEIKLSRQHEILTNEKVWKEQHSTSFQELREKYFEIQDLKAQLQDRNIAIRVIHNTSVSRPQLRSNQVKDKVVQNNSQVKIKQKEVEDHRIISSISNKSKSVTACNDSLKSGTSNDKVVCATCGKCVFNSDHDACVSRFLNDVNARSKKPQGNDLLTGNRGSDLYIISLQESSSPTPICFLAKASPTQAWLWHRRLSHLNFDTINLLSKNDIVKGLPKLKFIKDQLCLSCEIGKAKRSSFKSLTVTRSKKRLNLLHVELCGPMRIETINGNKYILVIIDDYSRYTWMIFLRSKDETPELLKDFLKMIQHKLRAQIITVRTDRGTKSLNKTLHAYFKEEGIEHQTSTPRTPKQNGVVKRRNRTVAEAARTMLSASKLPLFFLG
ncbi:retrovirus-related pol polyprotein from transposon TNT 1-94 [Tanacetum coccineum]